MAGWVLPSVESPLGEASQRSVALREACRVVIRTRLGGNKGVPAREEHPFRCSPRAVKSRRTRSGLRSASRSALHK